MEPPWLAAWRARGASPEKALAHFDALPSPAPERLVGLWRGETLRTGHLLDGLLEALGWHGKAVEAPDRVHPLLFRRPGGEVWALEPAWMPTALALAMPRLARSAPSRGAFLALQPLLRARHPGAALEQQPFRGRTGTALVYHRQPIADHLRAIGPDRVLGLMERRGMAQPFLFLLTRERDDRPFPPE